tara:strand:+ start:605 stop:841 length:237 start_codon:yes stop_codon:yes gene_type:complete
MGEFKLMNTKEYFNFINDSTFIGNVNTGQVIPPNVYTLQKPVQPMAKSDKMVYNSINNNFYKDNTKIQSNIYNPRGAL